MLLHQTEYAAPLPGHQLNDGQWCESEDRPHRGSPYCVLTATREAAGDEEPCQAFTKPPLLQESRLTGGGSPNLVGLVEWKVPVEWEIGAANSFH